MKIVMTGARGLIGSAVSRALLAEGHRVVSLTRSANLQAMEGRLVHIPWDGSSQGKWTEHIDGADAIINLAGEPIAGGRWTASRKGRIVGSRVDAANAIVRAIAHARQKPGVLINASAVGYYGNVEEGDVTEAHPPGEGFLSEICVRWEDEALKARATVPRVVLLRTGIVLDASGGALPKMALPFRVFAGGSVGSGNQWMPWIHKDDVTGIILHALRNESLDGPVNVSAPVPVRMKEFCIELGRALGRPSWLPVPSFALKLLLGEMSAMLLGGQRVVPTKVMASGYTFRHQTLPDALVAIFQKPID